MKMSTTVWFVVLTGLAFGACDDGTGPESGSGTLVGTWISVAYDLAPGTRAQSGGRESVVTTFAADSTWETFEYSPTRSLPYRSAGIYEVEDGTGAVRAITLRAEPPETEIVKAGIFEVTGDRLQIEVVRPWDFIPATVEGGFGSTLTLADSVGTGAYWIQIYERRE